MPPRSTIERLPGLAAMLREAVAQGRTIDEITETLNTALAEAGLEARVSRSAVGRAAKREAETLREAELLAAKRQADAVCAMLGAHMARGGDSEMQAAGRTELMRSLLFETMMRAREEITPAEMQHIAGAWERIERTGGVQERRLAEARERERAEAAERERAEAAERGQAEAQRQGVRGDVMAAISRAILGAESGADG